MRPHLKESDFIDRCQRQFKQAYHLMYLAEADKVVSILGYCLTEHLAWGKAMYIDDFATHSQVNGTGYGGKLMEWAVAQAREQGCDQIHLDTGYTRHDAHRFYLKYGFKLASHHMSMML